jgi:isocitrate/isopropylmalate dehydrogenase
MLSPLYGRYPYLDTQNLSISQASIDANGTPLTEEALTAAKRADAVLLGAIGGPVCLAFYFTSNLPQSTV